MNADYQAPALAHIARLHAYTPGMQPSGAGWVKLNTNESPYPPSPKVAEAVHAACDELRKYPSPTSADLRTAIAARHGLDASQVLVGNGSDDVLNLLMRAFGGSAGSAMTFPSYSLYPVLAAIEGAGIGEIPFDEDMRLPVDAIAGASCNLFYLTSPNAPTGVAFATADIGRILQRFRGILVVDEAYGDFAEEDAIPLLSRHPNLVVTRTFSKSQALAGLRVGYALSSPQVIGILDRVRDSYNVNRLSQAGALAAVLDAPYYADCIARIKATRDAFIRDLDALGWFTYRSATNFVFTRPRTPQGREGADVAVSLYEHLKANRILVRYFGSHPFTAPFLRISIGTDADMAAVDKAIQSWLMAQV